MIEQPLFAGKTAAKASARAIGADDAMAGRSSALPQNIAKDDPTLSNRRGLSG